jgi:hypothetical protein
LQVFVVLAPRVPVAESALAAAGRARLVTASWTGERRSDLFVVTPARLELARRERAAKKGS